MIIMFNTFINNDFTKSLFLISPRLVPHQSSNLYFFLSYINLYNFKLYLIKKYYELSIYFMDTSRFYEY